MLTNKKYSYLVDAQMVDFRDKISLIELMKAVLSAAGRNADENGFGMSHLMTMDCSWVLSRVFLEMYRMPLADETLVIETWIEDVTTVVSNRNFKIYDGAGELIGGASSMWAAINLLTRRSVPIDTIVDYDEFVTGEPGVVRKVKKIVPFDGDLSNRVEIKYSDLDRNEHVNTLNYVRWISDCFTPEFYKTRRIQEFEINFLAEMRYDDVAEVYKKELRPGEECCFDIKNAQEKSVCRARLLFSETAPRG